MLRGQKALRVCQPGFKLKPFQDSACESMAVFTRSLGMFTLDGPGVHLLLWSHLQGEPLHKFWVVGDESKRWAFWIGSPSMASGFSRKHLTLGCSQIADFTGFSTKNSLPL